MGKNRDEHRRWSERECCQEVYSNRMAMYGTGSDIRLLFSQVVSHDVEGGQEQEIVERVAVTVSWQNAKMFRDALSRAIAQYEAGRGVIDITHAEISDIFKPLVPARR